MAVNNNASASKISKIKQFPTKRTERIERICEDVNEEEPIGIGIRAEKLFMYGYAERKEGLVKLQRSGKSTKIIPLLNAKINIRVKRRVYRVPDRVEKEPEPHGVVYDTEITSLENNEVNTLDIHLSDMQSQKPQFWQNIHAVSIPHKRYQNDAIHAFQVIGELSPTEKRFDASGILRTNDGFIFLNPASGALTSQGMNDQYRIQFSQHVASKLTAISYGWERPSTLEEQITDFQTILKIRRVAPKSVGYGDILLALLGFCPFSQVCDTGGIWAIIHGLTGSMKSATSRLILQAYASVWGLQETSTINLREEASKIFAIEQVLHVLAGMFAHLDDGLKGNDISPQDVKKFWTMISTVGGHSATRQGAKRGVWASGEGGFGIEPYPRGSGVITVETLPSSESHSSDLARFLTVSLDGIECVDLPLLTELQNEQSAKAMNRATCSYIIWLLPHIQQLLQSIPERAKVYREHDIHSRAVMSYAKAELAIDAIYQYGVSIGAITVEEAKNELKASRENLINAASRQKALMGIEGKKSSANNPVNIFYDFLHDLLRTHKLYASDAAYREATQLGTTDKAFLPQPPQFLKQQNIVDDKESEWGFTWNENASVFNAPNGSMEAGVLKYDGSTKVLLYTHVQTFEKIIYPMIVKQSVNTPLPGYHEMIEKLTEAGKLTRPKQATHLHGRNSKTARCYIIDMTPDKELDEIDKIPTKQEQTENLAISSQQSVTSNQQIPIDQIEEDPDEYELACNLMQELADKGYGLEYLPDGKRLLHRPNNWTLTQTNEEEAFKEQIKQLDKPLRDYHTSEPEPPTPIPPKPSEKRAKQTAYVDVNTEEGITLSGTQFSFPVNCSLPELVQALPDTHARVFLCGQLPENYEQWLLDVAMFGNYRTGKRGFHFDRKDATGHVARFEHLITGNELEIRTMSAWLGDMNYTACQARDAILLLNQYLQSAFTPDTSAYSTPSQTLQQIWTRQNRIDGKKYELLSQEIRDIIHASSGQGRVELCTQDDIKKIKELHYYDGVFMYAGLTWGMPTELDTHDHKNVYAGKVPAYYHIRYTVPTSWQHVGLFMTARDNDNWQYPGDRCQGQTFETWVNGSELDVLRDCYETVEAGMQAWNVTILERIVFKEEKDSTIKKPLDSIAKKLVSMREQVEQDAKFSGEREPIYKLVRGMMRNILLHGIGSFHRNKRDTTIIVREGEPTPDTINSAPIDLGNGLWSYSVPGKIDTYSEQFDHPEWSALVWARCRARMTKWALSLPRESIIAIRTDAIATTKEVPEWKSSSKVGTLREKWTINKQLKAPHSYEELDAIVEKYVKEGR